MATQETIWPCTECGERDAVGMIEGPRGFNMKCFTCGAEGEVKPTHEEALAAWNATAGPDGA